MASKGSGKSHTINHIYSQLQEKDPAFISDLLLDNNRFYDILKIDDSYVPMNLVKVLLDSYSFKDEVFVCNGLKLFITLEDVLFITGLPVEGKLIANASKSRKAFKDVFELPFEATICTIETIKDIVLNVNKSRADRMKALWLILITCFIVPTGDGHRVKADLVAYVNDVTAVTSYAWGVALLSYLHAGIRKWKRTSEPKTSIDGNLWVLLAFFLIRMPKLVSLLNLNVDDSQDRVPLVLKYVTALKKLSKNNKFKYDEVQSYLANVTTEEVSWTPYAGLQLPENLKGQEKYGLLLGPLCYMDSLVYHKPHCTPCQFPTLAEVQLDTLTWVERPLPHVENSGQWPQNFEKRYEKELENWDKKMVTDWLPQSEERDASEDQSESFRIPQESEREREESEREMSCPDNFFLWGDNELDDDEHLVHYLEKTKSARIDHLKMAKSARSNDEEESETEREESERDQSFGDRKESPEQQDRENSKKRKEVDNSGSSTQKSRLKRKIHVNVKYTYESGHSLRYWRKSAALTNKVCKYLDRVVDPDIILLQCSGNYATLKDCRFYKDGQSVSDNYVRVAAYLYTDTWGLQYKGASHRIMLDPTFAVRALQGSTDLSKYTKHMMDIHYN